MGKSNIIVNRWLSQKDRFADLMNGCLFRGRQIVLPDQLEKIDRETDLFISGKYKKTQGIGIQRYRDIVMRWKGQAELAILAVENQEHIHYAMPIRAMIYDGLSYADQIEEIWNIRVKANCGMDAGEFLSHFRKTDQLYPIITLVFYYGSKPWDGNKDLHEMIFKKKNCSGEELRKYIPNYKINLIDAERIQNTDLFQTDLQYVLNMIQYRERKEKILEYVDSHRSYFQKMSLDSYQALSVFLNSEKWLKKINISEKEEINMCKALEEIYADGIEQGIAKEKKKLISIKLQKGKTLESIADEMEEDMETVRRLMREIQYSE